MSEKIFISYNHSDKQIVDIIAQRLELEFGRNNIFYDAWSIQPGESIIGKMSEGLETFSVFFFFISPNSLSSKMVSLEWQSALNRAINSDLKFVAVRIADCNTPVILSDKLYIDLYGEGMDSALEKMKCVIKSESTYKPLENIDNLHAKVERIDGKCFRFTVAASLYAEPNPVFAFACSNSFEDYSVCFNVSEGYSISGRDEITTEEGKILYARTVQLQRVLKPNFPFVFEVTANNIAGLHNVSLYLMTDSTKRLYRGIEIKNVE